MAHCSITIIVTYCSITIIVARCSITIIVARCPLLAPTTPQPATPQPLPATPQPTIIASPPPSPFPEPHWPELHFEVISDDEEESAAEDKLTSLPYPLARTPMNGRGWELLRRQGFRGGGLGKNLQGRMEPVTRTNRVAGGGSGLGYDGENSRLEGSIMVFVKAGELENNNTSTEIYTPHFTPSDLANQGLSHLIQWPSNCFAWEGVANAGIPLKPSSKSPISWLATSGASYHILINLC